LWELKLLRMAVFGLIEGGVKGAGSFTLFSFRFLLFSAFLAKFASLTAKSAISLQRGESG